MAAKVGAKSLPKVAEPAAAFGAEVSVSATVAQNEFGRMLNTAAQNRVVVINRHNAPSAVLISIDRYRELTQCSANALGALTSQFDALVQRMKTPPMQDALQRAFDASPATLSQRASTQGQRSKRK